MFIFPMSIDWLPLKILSLIRYELAIFFKYLGKHCICYYSFKIKFELINENDACKSQIERACFEKGLIKTCSYFIELLN